MGPQQPFKFANGSKHSYQNDNDHSITKSKCVLMIAYDTPPSVKKLNSVS